LISFSAFFAAIDIFDYLRHTLMMSQIVFDNIFATIASQAFEPPL
jgi:hypothetical protein